MQLQNIKKAINKKTEPTGELAVHKISDKISSMKKKDQIEKKYTM